MSAVTDERPIGYGRLRRKEDARFIRGQGTYVDDILVPGTLHGAILRSPLAHARIASIDTAAQISGKAASMGEGVVVSVLDGLIKDFTQKLQAI